MAEYTVSDQQNCRKFFKRIYDFEPLLSIEFVNELREFGEVKINKFSEIVPGALDLFKIIKGDLEISGAINGQSIYIIIPKETPEILESLESKLHNYLKEF